MTENGAKPGDIYMLAFDHEVEFDELFVSGETSSLRERSLIRFAKSLVFSGVETAISRGLPRENAAILIDELYGTAVAREATDAGVSFSMPVDPPGREFTFRFDDWQGHLEHYKPTWAKPLLWLNVEGDAEKNRRQVERAKQLQTWLHDNGQQLLVEILILPEEHQLASVGGSRARFEAELLPGLITKAMDEVAATIVPDVWKIEGVPTAEGTQLIGEKVLSFPFDARCLVLGRGATLDIVKNWLAMAGSTEGYCGFAVGRTIWQDAVKSWLSDRDDDTLVNTVADRYLELVRAYQGQTGS
jgi:myo-inositol catabolism protein IolC